MTRARWIVAGAACIPAVLTAVRLAGWWPCDVACQGGGVYERVAALSVLWAGLAGYLALAALALYDAWRSPRWSPVTCGLIGLLAGASLFYLWVAWSLELLCPFCLTVHGVVLALLLAIAPDAAGATAVCLLFGLLGMNAVFHHRVVADVAAPTAAAPALPPGRAAIAADANRTRGRADAPLTVDYGYSLQCGHCAEQHGPILDALGPAIAAGTVRLVLRPVIRPADEGSAWLARWSYAAAARSPAELDRFLIERLATKSALTRDELLALGGDLPAYDATAAGGTFDALLDDDQRVLRTLGYKGSTPFIVISRGSQVLGRFFRDIPLAEVSRLIQAPAP